MPEQDDAQTGGDKTFTQAELEAIISDRLKRQAAQLKKDQPDETELQKLRDAQAQLEAIENASKDDLEKANETIAALQEKVSTLESENSGLQTNLRETTIKQAVLSEAAKTQFGEEKSDTFVDPDDAYRFLNADEIEFDDDGNPTNLAEVVGKIAESKPHLLGARRTAGPDMDLGPRETTTDRPDMTPEREHAQWLAERL